MRLFIPYTTILLFASQTIYSQSYNIKDYELKPYHTDTFPDWKLLTYRFYTIQFEFDKADLRSSAYAELDSLAEWMVKHSEITFEIGVHLDTRWRDEYSLNLSGKRAYSIVDYLIKKGVNKNRLISKGYSDEIPIFNEDYIAKIKGTEDEELAQKINRRVELRAILD